MGRFPDGYGVDEEEYRRRKYNDMVEYDLQHPEKITKKQIECELQKINLQRYLKIHPKATRKECGNVFGVSEKTITVWKSGGVPESRLTTNNYNNKLTIKEIEVDEEALEKTEKEKGVANESELDPPIQ